MRGYVLFCGADIVLPEPYSAGDFPLFEKRPEGRAASFAFGDGEYGSLEIAEVDAGYLSGAQRMPLRSFIGSASPAGASLALKARAYAHWVHVTRFCSFCGAPLGGSGGGIPTGLVDRPGIPAEPGDERAMICAGCGRAHFPRISPAIIVLVRRGRQMLLAHNAKFPAGRHGLIAGFVDPGETLEDTVHREVMEEAGIEIEAPRYVRSQPWPFPDSLMLGFEADYRSGMIRPDGIEIDSLGWYEPERLPDIPPHGSVARFLIDRFISSL
jgi:NAD+ diphosphatase